MSKIIKDSVGFVPEKILSVDLDRPAVWKNLAGPAERESEENDTEDVFGQDLNIEPADDQNPTEAASDSYSFDSDFSSPESGDGVDNTAPPPERIDLEALTEEFYNKGVEAGIERMESDYGSTIKTLQSVCEQLSSVHETILKNSLEEMQNMVLQIAEKILRQSVASQKETIIGTVEEAIQLAVKSDEFLIRVNPDDYETIKSRSTDFIHAMNGLENINVKSDASVERGGCLIESNNCIVDATIASQLEIISDSVKSK